MAHLSLEGFGLGAGAFFYTLGVLGLGVRGV